MNVELPPKITKQIANQARMTVASVLNYAHNEENIEQEAVVACYDSIIHELLKPLETPWERDRQHTPDREMELFDILCKRYSNTDVYYGKTSNYNKNSIFINLGQGIVVKLNWNKYNYYFSLSFSSTDINSLDFIYEDFIKALPTLDFVRDNIHTWRPLAEECIRDFRKKQKLREIKATAVKSFAISKLDSCGIPYRIEQGKLRDKIYFKISDKDMAMFYLSHKNFNTAIDKIIVAAGQIRELVSETDLQLQVKKIDHYTFFNDK